MRPAVIALAQHKRTKVPCYLRDAIILLELIIELDLVYYGENSALTKEDKSLC